MTSPHIRDSEQSVLNQSFDDEYKTLTVSPLGFTGTSMRSMPMPFLTKPFDRIIITYTDATKETVSTIVTKLNGVTQETLTNSSTSTVDDFARS